MWRTYTMALLSETGRVRRRTEVYAPDLATAFVCARLVFNFSSAPVRCDGSIEGRRFPLSAEV